MRIGELSEATGVSARSLRYYEEQGLLQSHRRANAYRDYPPDAVQQVAFIQDLLSAGLTSQIIRDILPCVGHAQPQEDCAALVSRVRQVRDDLARQERRLAERRETLDRYLAGTTTPRGLRVP